MPINLDDLGNFDNLEDLNKILEKRMKEHNSIAAPGFDGLSPERMAALQTSFPENHPKSPLVKNYLKPMELAQCPLLMQLRFLMEKLRGGKEIKLTRTGALPTAVVKELYEQGHLKNYWIENGYSKVNREGEIMEVLITRLLLEISSLAKKRNHKLSLTRKGEKIIDDGNAILDELLQILLYKFNWGYFDGYESENIGQVIPGFSIYLIKKYGDKERSSKFYAQKYFEAFPHLRGNKNDFNCYKSRTFSRYFKFLGLVKIPDKTLFDEEMMVAKTPFCDLLFSLQNK